MVINLALAVAALVIVVVAGSAGFGLGAPRELGGFTLALALSIAAMFAIGLWISAIARTQNAAQGIGQLLVCGRRCSSPACSSPGGPCQPYCGTPSGAAVHALQDSMLGTFPSAQLLLVLAGWAVVFGFLAVRFFRWE